MFKPGYNTAAIIIGVVIFLGLFTYPFWANIGKTATPPKLEVGTTEKQCVEATAYMKSSHMKLLDQWRDDVVRGGKRIYVSTSGKQYEMSLQNTCTKCHAKKEEFCDRCHTYVDASPKCWDCHIDPKTQAQPQKAAQSAENQAVRSNN
jgi:hypothetical protein